MYRRRGGEVEILLVHAGGPFWARKNQGAWFIPKGELEAGEDRLAGARREFSEETGFPCPASAAESAYLPLGETRRSGGKTIHIYAFAGDCDPAAVRSNTFELEWPPHSGRRQVFPEVDRAAFFPLSAAAEFLHPGECVFLTRLAEALAVGR